MCRSVVPKKIICRTNLRSALRSRSRLDSSCNRSCLKTILRTNLRSALRSRGRLDSSCNAADSHSTAIGSVRFPLCRHRSRSHSSARIRFSGDTHDSCGKRRFPRRRGLSANARLCRRKRALRQGESRGERLRNLFARAQTTGVACILFRS